MSNPLMTLGARLPSPLKHLATKDQYSSSAAPIGSAQRTSVPRAKLFISPCNRVTFHHHLQARGERVSPYSFLSLVHELRWSLYCAF